MGIRMGYWDCRACGTKRIQGPERQCPNCGQPRAADVAFYSDDNAPLVDDSEMLKRAKAGVDWHCPYCGADNPAGSKACVGCGASTEGAKTRQEKLLLDAPPPPPQKRSSGSKKWIFAGLAVLISLIFGVWFLVFRTTDASVTVAQKTWRKSISVERLETDRGEAWDEDVPAGARRVDAFGKKRTVKVQDGTERVKVGKKDLGNGFFEDVYEERPKYVNKEVTDTWVRYEIDRWKTHRTLKEEARDGQEPPWPRFDPGPREREGSRESQIVLDLKSGDGKTYEYSINAQSEAARAARFEVGKSYTASINALGMVMELR